MNEEPEESLAASVEDEPDTATEVAIGVFAQLRRIDNSGPTDELFHVGDTCLIGRHDPAVSDVDVDLSDLPDCKFVSRRHATIEHEGGLWFLTDLGSSNGTYLYRKGEPNFIKVEERLEVHDADEIVFGNLRFRFENPSEAQSQAEDPIE